MRLGVRAQLALLGLGLISVTALVADATLTRSLEQVLTQRISADLLVRLELIEREASSQIVSLEDPGPWVEVAADFSRRSNVRVTIVNAAGAVLGDSLPGAPPSLAGQPEITEALAHGFGQATREGQMFVAAPFRWEDVAMGVVRLGLPVAEVDEAVGQLRRTVLFGWLLSLTLAGFGAIVVAQLASRRVRKITAVARQLAAGDLTARTGVGGRDELSQLGRTLDQLAEGLSTSLATLRSERDRLRWLESMRRDFVANVSHELKTPLTSIRTATETLQAGALGDPAVAGEFVEVVARNADRLSRLVGDLLELAHVESGKLRLRPEQVELAAAVEACLAQYRPAALARAVELRAEAPPAGAGLWADRRGLEQLLGNLVDNAVKFSPKGATVRVRVLEQPDAIRLVVEDDGPGIAPEHLPRLFERFYRADDSRSREAGGSGLGLAIVRHLAEAMGGSVGVESAPGKGSAFSVTLPSREGASGARIGHPRGLQ